MTIHAQPSSNYKAMGTWKVSRAALAYLYVSDITYV